MVGVRTTLILVALTACSKGNAVSESPRIDASPVLEYGPLVGSWTGARYVSSVGAVSGLVSIDARGQGNFVATVAGVSHSDTLQIEALTKTHVQGSAMGQTRRFPIEVAADRLRLEVAGIGEVVLTRVP